MRDDVKNFFNDLLTHLDEKIHYTESLLENIRQISILIDRTDKEEDILKILNQNQNLIDKINSEDYYISGIKDEITRRFSLDLEKIFREPTNIPETEIMECRQKIILIKNLTKEITGLNQQNYNNIQNAADDLKHQISELNRMSRISLIFPGDE